MSLAARLQRPGHVQSLVLVAAASLAGTLVWRIGVAAFYPQLHPFWLIVGYAAAAKAAGDAVATRLREGGAVRPAGTLLDDAFAWSRWAFPLCVFQRLASAYPWLGPLTPVVAGPLPAVVVYLVDLYPRFSRGVAEGSFSDRTARWP